MQSGSNDAFGPRDHFPSWVIREDALTPQQCAALVKLTQSLPREEAALSASGSEQELDSSYRNTITYRMDEAPDTQSIYDFFNRTTRDANEVAFGFELNEIRESIQILEYPPTGGKYDWHIDVGSGPLSLRKLTVLVQLSDPNDYEGGRLQLRTSDEPMEVSRKQGTIAIFPTFVLHRVMPVTSGKRYSLVAWMWGSHPFR